MRPKDIGELLVWLESEETTGLIAAVPSKDTREIWASALKDLLYECGTTMSELVHYIDDLQRGVKF